MSTVSDPVPVGLTIGATVDEILTRAETDYAAAQWWYRFGFEVGKSAGRAESDALIEQIRLDRAEVASMRPTGETCRCGRAEYRRWAS